MRTRISLLNIILGACLVFLSNCSKTGPTKQSKLIAHYPLTSDALDATGLNPAMTLRNTPFQNGAIYCNGIYQYSSDSNYCIALSPAINSLNLGSFSISMDFMVSEIKRQPVWIIGTGCRWLGFLLNENGTIELLYNNANTLQTSKSYSVNTWHNAKISYDGTTVSIYIDNNLAAAVKFGNGYVPLDYADCGMNDTEIGVTNYSDGQVFNGFVKNLEVYNIQ